MAWARLRTSSPTPWPSEVRRARRSTNLLFAVHGCVIGSFAARVPSIASHVGVGVGQLGVALLMPGIGAILAMPLSGRLAHDHPFPVLVTTTIAAWCGSLVLPALAASLPALCAVLLVFGAASGISDMAINAQGVLIERRAGQSVMSTFHGCWSAGVLTGSVASALAAHVGFEALPQFGATAVLLALIAAGAARALLPEDSPHAASAPPRFALPTRPVLLIGLVGLCAIFGEQAGTDWSALFLRRELAQSASTAALAVSGFAVTMALARLSGDRLIRWLGPVRIVRLSGTCAAGGMVVVVLAPNLVAAFAGFALLGAGVALVVPLVFAAAGRVGAHPARSIAGVAGIAYGSGLITPGVIGAVASATSLKVSFGLVAGVLAMVPLAAGVLRPPDARTSGTDTHRREPTSEI